MLNIHKHIEDKLDNFIKSSKIPNILFHGGAGSGKKILVANFINKIYKNNAADIKTYVLYVNCSHCKGIKFIREDLKFFAKTHINSNDGLLFKSIVLLNADKLTVDAQSALRRSIEVFSNTTRVFIIVEDKYKLLKPILSRFCEICIHNPIIDGSATNLYNYNVIQTYGSPTAYMVCRQANLRTTLEQLDEKVKNTPALTIDDLIIVAEQLYEGAYSANDVIKYYQDKYPREFKYLQMLLAYNKMKIEIRNEKLAILFCLNFEFISSNADLQNISVM